MKLSIALWLAGAAATGAAAQPHLDLQEVAAGHELTAPEIPNRTISYGGEYWQLIDYWPPRKSAALAPAVIMIHGNDALEYDLSWMIDRLHSEGFAVASVRYRVDGRRKLRQAIRDVASAIAHLCSGSERRRVDPGRILLLGTGAGAQIAALLATDPAWLETAGVPFASLRGVVTVNGAGFDIEETLAHSPPHRRGDYRRLFGPEPAERSGLSPLDHAGPPNAPGFLFLFEGQEGRLRAEAEKGATRLAAAGVPARAEALPKWRRDVRDTYLLAPEGGVGNSLLAFLRDSAGMPGSGATSSQGRQARPR